MAEKVTYNKLVRNNVPDLIMESGKSVTCRKIVDDYEYRDLLIQKNKRRN